ncbi:MAG: helix-turn-helix domain-containing protein [Oscillospiraceae bacterium]|nr:helix-turn-helix domain-containing protein [Oscillospiraceae bacterium]
MSKNMYRNYDELPLSLTAEDLCKVLGISRSGAYNLLHAKNFPALKIGHRLLCPRDRFLKWMNSQIDE